MQLNIKFEEKNSFVVNEINILNDLSEYFNEFPDPNDQLMPGIKWGCYTELFTPAYWKVQYLMHNFNNIFNINYKLGSNLLEEVVACLLGGFGLKAEMGLAAFQRLKMRKQIQQGMNFDEILESLKEPFIMGNKTAHYRFPNQKAKFIHAFLNREDLQAIPANLDLDLRDWLLTVNGIGPKTASWITRNYLDSERVAIIDVHIFRACSMMGLYAESFDIQKDYTKLEQLFLNFCSKLDVLPSKMDALIWLQMKDSIRKF
jgi:thermostable 8-oxoguanine DNA glycosylase